MVAGCPWETPAGVQLMAALSAAGFGRGPATVEEARRGIAVEEARIRVLAPLTQEGYRTVLRRFRAQLDLEEASPNPDPRLAVLRAVATFPVSNRHVASGIARRMGYDVPRCAQSSPEPHPLTLEQWRRIVVTFVRDTPRPPRKPDRHGVERVYRDRAALLLLALTGLRPRDAASARVRDWRRPRLALVQKGRRRRDIVVPALAADAIDDYLVRRSVGVDVEELFLGYSACGGLSAVTPAALSVSITARARRHRLPGFEVRQLRSTVATLLSDHGPALVAAALGHQNMRTALHYVDPTRRQGEAVALLEQLLPVSAEVSTRATVEREYATPA